MYYFAWISDENEPFSEAHHRVDEDVYSYTLEQTEGEFATLTVELRNPKVGVLSPSRNQWVWFSRTDGVTVTPLFRGRISSIPENLDREVMSLEFIARPSDFVTRKAALAETLKVHPYYDRVWIPEDDESDPDTVLEGRSALWHIDRVTHDVTISDFNAGEDGTLTALPSSVLEDSVSVTFGSLPVDTVSMTAKVSWDQIAKRTIDISGVINQGFDGDVSSYTGQGLQSTWPIEDDDIGGDWKFGPCTLNLLSGKRLAARYVDCSIQPAPPTMTEAVTARFYLWQFSQSTTVKCDTSRARTETITFTATANVQSFKSTEVPEPLELSYDSERIVDKIDNGDTEMPLGSVARRTYFGTDRGALSIAFLMCVVRANFMKSARAVEIEFQIPLDEMIGVNLRKSVLLQHPNLPGGGVAIGKVISYSMSLDGSNGEEVATVRIGCTIGKGSALAAPATGTPSYDEGDYGTGYEIYLGSSIQPIAGEIEYSLPEITLGAGGTVIDDGMDLETMGPSEIVSSFVVINRANDQVGVLFAGSDTIDNAIDALNALYTKCQLTLVPLNTGPFDNSFPMVVEPFSVPKTLDLET